MSEPLYFHVLDGHDLGPAVFGEAAQDKDADGTDVLRFSVAKPAGGAREVIPPSCSAYHPHQTFAMPGDKDGYCADCRAQQDTINQDAHEQRERSQRRRQRLISLFGTPIPDWVRDVVLMLSLSAAMLFFAWNVGR